MFSSKKKKILQIPPNQKFLKFQILQIQQIFKSFNLAQADHVAAEQ
jgi:hypothetical protein